MVQHDMKDEDLLDETSSILGLSHPVGHTLECRHSEGDGRVAETKATTLARLYAQPLHPRSNYWDADQKGS